jgi:hypothetical protein
MVSKLNTVCFYVLKVLLKNFKIFLVVALFQIIFVFLNCYNVLILKINFKI